MPSSDARKETLSLEKAATHLLEECRMVLPGIQALLGFQLVAVFSTTFRDTLSHSEQLAHLIAMLCVVLAVALVMAPAAVHRVREPASVSQAFLTLSSRLLMLGMLPVAAATSVDVYLIARVISHSTPVALTAGMLCVVIFLSAWLIVPWRARLP